jgi:pimeloyl-ACP methyl ester carboxylesterase
MLARYPAADLLQTQAAGTDTPMIEAVIAARIPVLVINGEFDLHTRKEAGEALARVLPGSQYVSIPNAGHLPNLDNPAAYNAVLRFFLGRNQTRLSQEPSL